MAIISLVIALLPARVSWACLKLFAKMLVKPGQILHDLASWHQRHQVQFYSHQDSDFGWAILWSVIFVLCGYLRDFILEDKYFARSRPMYKLICCFKTVLMIIIKYQPGTTETDRASSECAIIKMFCGRIPSTTQIWVRAVTSVGWPELEVWFGRN